MLRANVRTHGLCELIGRVSGIERALISGAALAATMTLACSIGAAPAASQTRLRAHTNAALETAYNSEFQGRKPAVSDAAYVCTPSGFGRKATCALRDHQT
jgi:hypothetical protein